MDYYTYDFMITASKNGSYIAADQQGGSYYLPKEILKHLRERIHISDLIHVMTTEKLEFTERTATNSIICHGQIKVSMHHSAERKTALFLVSRTAYGSMLLTNPYTGKDQLICTSYLSEGYRTPGIHWNTVTEGNIVRFLLFGNMPVMPAPRKHHGYGFFRPVIR